jgi:uncharacterized protein (UPF0261 family)
MSKKHIAIIATCDTKGAEVAFMASLIKDRGFDPVVVDVGPMTPASAHYDFTNQRVAKLAGWELADLVGTHQRDRIMTAMGMGAIKALQALLKVDRLDGVIGIGGNQGSAMASMAMQSLPIGFPKFLVSTVASGNIRPYIGHKDIGVMFSVADLVGGPNLVSRSILTNAVAALMGMVVNGEKISLHHGEKNIAISAFGNTEPAVQRISALLNEKGFHVIAFHASGAGGTAMEELIEDGVFHGLVDLTPHELTEEVVGAGAYVPVRPGRMQAAARSGIPQVVSTGAMEYLCFGPKESIPPKFRKRKTYFHNPNNANVKATRAEMSQVGKVMAERLNEAKGKTEILVPLKGSSVYGSKGGPLYDPAGSARLLKALKQNLNPKIQLKEIDAHINDPKFADICVSRFLHLFHQERP